MVNSLAAKYPTEFSFLAQPYAFLKSPAFALIIIIVPHDWNTFTDWRETCHTYHSSQRQEKETWTFDSHLVKKCTLKRRINFCAIQINNVFAVCSFFFFELGENGRHNKTPNGLSWSTGKRKFCFPITIDVSFAGLRLREPLGSQGNKTYDFAWAQSINKLIFDTVSYAG